VKCSATHQAVAAGDSTRIPPDKYPKGHKTEIQGFYFMGIAGFQLPLE